MPKFTLRELFFVVTLAAVLVAWWVDHRRQSAVHAELVHKVQTLGFQLDTVSSAGAGKEVRSFTLNSDGSATLTFAPYRPEPPPEGVKITPQLERVVKRFFGI